MQRRDFMKFTAVGIGALMLPKYAVSSIIDRHTAALDISQKKRLADIALNEAKSKGATYCDVRLGRYLNQYIFSREDKIQNVVDTLSAGIGIRVIANGTWGFASTDNLTPESIALAASEAVAIAKANSVYQTEPVSLAPQKGLGEVSWKTPLDLDAFTIPIKDKAELLLSANSAAMKKGADYISSVLFFVNEQKYFASSDGSYIDQDVHRIWPTFQVTCIDKQTGKFQSRDAFSSPMGMGFEYLTPQASEKIKGVATSYRHRYDMIEDAENAAREARQKLTAKSVTAGKYDLVLDPSHLYLTIHESVGHPLELDRVLGYEANYAGTSFATLEKWKSKSFKYGSPIVTLFADKTQKYSLGAVGYDDEGVPTKRWDLVKDGILVNYQAIRDQVQIIDQNESHGCCYADNWASVQFQRMPNVSLAPGKKRLSVSEMIKNVDKGIYIVGAGSYSIDQQRYNFQFGGQLFFEIKKGKIGEMLKDVSYQSNTQEFWNSCVAICDERDYRIGGTFFDGKGQPGQISAVSHGASTARFNGVNVINTDRKI